MRTALTASEGVFVDLNDENTIEIAGVKHRWKA
jgi:hypothetical protein